MLQEIIDDPQKALLDVIKKEKYIKNLEREVDEMHIAMNEVYQSGLILDESIEKIIRRSLKLPVFDDFDQFGKESDK